MARQSMVAFGMVLPLGTLVTLGLATVLFACGDSSSTGGSGGAGGGATKPCNQAPFQCKAGQTCWPNQNVTAFQCLNSGPGKRGDACQLIGGQVTCGDGLICIALQDPKNGVCTPYCDPTDPSHGCPDNEVCAKIGINGQALQLNACNPATTSTTSTTTTSSSTATSGSSTSASSASSASSTSSTGTGM